jgi:hypothetical protein
MAFYVENDLLVSQGNISNIKFLEQIFSQLSAEGQTRLKDYLKSLVSLQNAITGMEYADSVCVSLKRNRNGN